MISRRSDGILPPAMPLPQAADEAIKKDPPPAAAPAKTPALLTNEITDMPPSPVPVTSRRELFITRQAARRQREHRVRKAAAQICQQVKSSCSQVARELGIEPRTLCHWKQSQQRGTCQPRPLGRPPKEPTADQVHKTWNLLAQHGAFRHRNAACRTGPASLYRRPRGHGYRDWHRVKYRRGQQRLTWLWPGSVWAIRQQNRSDFFAAKHGHPFCTSADLAASRHQANCLHRPEDRPHATPQQVWDDRDANTADDRAAFDEHRAILPKIVTTRGRMLAWSETQCAALSLSLDCCPLPRGPFLYQICEVGKLYVGRHLPRRSACL